MSDYIDREAVKEAIGFIKLHFIECGENKSLLDVINEIPSADVSQVIRCKDCKNLIFSDFYGECGKGYMGIVHPDDFCSRGERKD